LPDESDRSGGTLIIGIDASRNRSGGARAHLLGILSDGDPLRHGIREVHVWSYRALLSLLPDRSWLVKHNPAELERSLFHQLRWQYHSLPAEARHVGCDVLLNTDAGSVCRFRPAVTMSRDMLSYEPGEIKRFGLSKARLRLLTLRIVQSQSMRFADGVIFLTQYAARVIQQTTGALHRIAVIPHGVGRAFVDRDSRAAWPTDSTRSIRCLYVSNAAMYKHQWEVVRAISLLRELVLAGGGRGRAARRLEKEIADNDPAGHFVKCLGVVPHDDLPSLLAGADLFVFASSCENMPNTLVEAMAIGLPIACSNRGPMPEVLRDGGVYFDPENPQAIAAAIEALIRDPELRMRVATRAKGLSGQYSWARCAAETWSFLRTVSESR
jgi:glycosyltransferase involved in cell wall biosynthesis